MEGAVKWFSKEKGYGFIVGDDGVDRYFHISAVQGVALPDHGDKVLFDDELGKPAKPDTKDIDCKVCC